MCSANDWESKQVWVFSLNKTNKYSCAPLRLLCNDLQQTYQQHKPLFSSSSNNLHSRSSKISVKTNNFSAVFPEAEAENNRSYVQKKHWKIVKKCQHKYLASVRNRSLALPKTMLAKHAFSLEIFCRAAVFLGLIQKPSGSG